MDEAGDAAPGLQDAVTVLHNGRKLLVPLVATEAVGTDGAASSALYDEGNLAVQRY